MLYGILIGILIFILLVVVLINVSPMFFMHPLETGKIEGTDIIAVKNRINNLFFVPSGEDWLAIDAGSDAGLVMQEMEKMSIDRHRVKGVFLTHTDYDHVASIPLFPNATIYISRQEEQMVDGSTRRKALEKNKLPKLRDSNKVVWILDNETVELGRRKVRMISAPGHTKGSAMYVVDEKYLFTGDAFKAEDGQILIHPYTMDKSQAQKTIHSIEAEWKKYEKVFTAHYGWIESGKK